LGPSRYVAFALYPDRVHLYFPRGGLLSKSDPNKLLQGRGNGVRHVVLHAVADFDRAEIEVLMAAALKLAKVRPDASAKGSVIIRAEAQKQRAARRKQRDRAPAKSVPRSA